MQKRRRVFQALISAIGLGAFPLAFTPFLAISRISRGVEISVENYSCAIQNILTMFILYTGGVIVPTILLCVIFSAMYFIQSYIKKDKLSFWNCLFIASGAIVFFMVLFLIVYGNKPCPIDL